MSLYVSTRHKQLSFVRDAALKRTCCREDQAKGHTDSFKNGGCRTVAREGEREREREREREGERKRKRKRRRKRKRKRKRRWRRRRKRKRKRKREEKRESVASHLPALEEVCVPGLMG
jgi:hypothetical protein